MISDIFGIGMVVLCVLELITLLDSTHLISQLMEKGWLQKKIQTHYDLEHVVPDLKLLPSH